MEVAPFQPAIMEVLSLSPTQNLTEKTLSHREAAGHHLSFWQILDANLPTKHRTIETKMQHNVKYVNHGPPKPTFLEAFMVNNLVFRWPKPLFFMVLGAHGIYTWNSKANQFLKWLAINWMIQKKSLLIGNGGCLT